MYGQFAVIVLKPKVKFSLSEFVLCLIQCIVVV